MACKQVVLVGSGEHDTSIRVIYTRLRRMKNVKPIIIDGSCFGDNLYPSVQFHRKSSLAKDVQFRSGNKRLCMDHVHSVWNRRGHEPKVLKQVASNRTAHAFARENWRCLVQGIYLCSDVKWVNPPDSQAVAANK